MELQLIVFGAGGHAKVVIDLIKLLGREIAFLVDNNTTRKEQLFCGYTIKCEAELDLREFVDRARFVNAVGGVGDMTVRSAVSQKIKSVGGKFETLVHPFSYVSPDAILAEGAQVMAGAVIQPGSHVGQNAIVNTSASIDHDCTIGAGVHIAPGAVLCGGVIVGEGAFVGAGATVIGGSRIGQNAVVGAGSLVRTDVAERASVVGVPAQVLHR